MNKAYFPKLSLTALVLFGLLAQTNLGVDAQNQSLKRPPDEYSKGLKLLKKPPEMPGITFPVAPAKFKHAFSNEGKGKTTQLGATFICPDSPMSVINYYGNSLKAQGWNVTEMKSQTLAANNPKMKASVNIMCESSPEGTSVQFGYLAPGLEPLDH